MTPPRWLWPTLVAAVLLSLLAAGDGILPGDLAVARAVQRAVPPELAALVGAVNGLGRAVPGALTMTLAIALLLLKARHHTAALLVAATLPLRAVNPILKTLVDSPRPTDSLVSVSERADGLGFPSGHATGAMLLYGAVIVVASMLTGSLYLGRIIRVLPSVAIPVAGVCRIEVGAHWPSDVVGGYLWGGVLLGALLAVVRLPLRNASKNHRSADRSTTSRRSVSETEADT